MTRYGRPPWKLVLGIAAALMALLPAAGVFASDDGSPANDASVRLLANRERAIQQILTSARGQDPFLRADAIEAAQSLPDRVVPMLQLGLDDAQPAVRFTALVTIGKLHLSTMAPAAQRLLSDKSDSVRAGAIFALRACGKKVDATPLAVMLTEQDLGVRSNVAMLLGLLGDPSAVPMLKDMATVPVLKASQGAEAVERIQIAEAMVKLGDPEALGVVRASCYSPFDEVRVLAVQIIGRTGDHRMERGLAAMLDRPPIELQLAAAEGACQAGARRWIGRDAAGGGIGVANRPEPGGLCPTLIFRQAGWRSSGETAGRSRGTGASGGRGGRRAAGQCTVSQCRDPGTMTGSTACGLISSLSVFAAANERIPGSRAASFLRE